MSLYSRLEQYLEEHSDDAGPVRGTLSLPRIGMIWLAANLVVTTLLTGTLFVPGVDYGLVIVLIIVGTLVGAAVLVTVGNIGTRTGLPTMALTRGPFGTRGSLLPVAANVIILMGWSWVQAMLAGIALDFLVASVTGFSSPVMFAVLCQTLVVILAIFGHTGIARVEPWLAVLILGIMAYIFVVAFTTYPPAEYLGIPADPSLGYTPILVLDVVIATAISWTVLSADFNRFAKSSRAGMIGSGVGYTLSTVISMVIGATAIGYVVLSGGEAIPFDPVTIVEPFGAPARRRDLPLGDGDEHHGRLRHGDDDRERRARAREAEVPADGAHRRHHLDHRLDLVRPAQPVHDVPRDDRRAVRPGVRDHDRRLLHRQARGLHGRHPEGARGPVLVPRRA